MQNPKLAASLNDAEGAIRSGDFSEAWDLLQNVLRQFRMVPGLARAEHLHLWRAISLLERMQKGSSYEPLDLALDAARKLYQANSDERLSA